MSQRAPLWTVVAVLAAHNVVGNLWLPQWSYVPANLVIGALVVWPALRSGVDTADISGPRSWLRGGVVAGMTAGSVVGAGIAVAALVPFAADLFADARVLGVGTVGLLFHTLVRIPIGTALFEEVAFRGVLPALGRRSTTPLRANLLAAALFGLWHVIPTASVAAANAGVAGFSGGLVIAGGVAGTALVGLGFSWIRDRWGLAAPILLHAIVNSVAFAVAWTMA
ncbi:MAG TPA: CPBP family intramembrane metalloprotease [Actinobacteria bacterium]|nr:CPBP family intramembrane metalloprotease [Actinomycetota bacterium]